MHGKGMHVCDTWHAMCHHAWPFESLYKGGLKISLCGGGRSFSPWEQQQGGGGREKEKEEERRREREEARKGEEKGKTKREEERGGREEKERGRGRSVAQ